MNEIVKPNMEAYIFIKDHHYWDAWEKIYVSPHAVIYNGGNQSGKCLIGCTPNIEGAKNNIIHNKFFQLFDFVLYFLKTKLYCLNKLVIEVFPLQME